MFAMIEQSALEFSEKLLGECGGLASFRQRLDDLMLARDMPLGFANVPLHHFQLGFARDHETP